MAGLRVETETGTWTVRRCWLPKRKIRWTSLKRKFPRQSAGDVLDVLDAFDPLGEGLVTAIGFVIAAVLFVAIAVYVLIPLLLIVFDVTVLVLLAVLATGARVVLHRPWEIEAVGPDETRLSWKVIGWRESRRTIADIEDRLRHGELLTATAPDHPTA